MAEFDPIAAAYDRTFTDTVTGWGQRKLVWAFLEKWLAEHPGRRVLEINCGTGEDACFLAEKGCSVTATDASAAMVAETARKAEDRGLAVRSAVLDLSAPGAPAPDEEPYDLVFSNFGGLNCLSIDQIAALRSFLEARLRPGGHFVAVFMPRCCPLETLYFLAKLRPGQAFRRWGGGPVQAPLGGGHSVRTWYFSPREFARALSPDFAEAHRRGIGIALPPSYLESFFRKKKSTWEKLEAWEKKWAERAYLAGTSDHCLMHFVRGREEKIHV
jgi:SAM-dependent methyltransferase